MESKHMNVREEKEYAESNEEERSTNLTQIIAYLFVTIIMLSLFLKIMFG
ncbi:MAG: hypothetical protein M3Z56_00520 [Bacteroidota bacterium]|nr:hypothetical protein [Bacteroidota bacterium]